MNNDEKWIKYGKLLSGLIHNLNTPLMGLSGRVELLQMKLGEDKSINQINTQLDRINKMLTSVAYLLDKEQSNKESELDLKVLLENYFSFLGTDMRFKHQLEKDLSFENCKVTINASDLIYTLHKIIDFSLDFIDEESNLIVNNSTLNDCAIINICLEFSSNVNKDYKLDDFINESINHDFIEKFGISSITEKNRAIIRYSLKLS